MMILPGLTLIAFGLGASCPAQAPTPSNQGEPGVRSVAIVIHQGVELLDFAGPGQVLATAGQRGPGEDPWFRLYTVAPEAEPIVSQGFVKVVPDYTIVNCPKPDVLIIPGGRTSELYGNPAFMQWIKKTAPETEITLTISTGIFVLAYADLLGDREVTTHWSATDALQQVAPKARVLTERRFVDSGELIASAGIAAGIDGALHLVGRTLGLATAQRTARYMEYRWTPMPPEVAQYPLANPALDEKSQLLERLQVAVDGQNWDASDKIFNAIVARYPDEGEVGYRYGLSLLSSGEHGRAVAVCRSNAKIAKGRFLYNSLYNLGCAHALAGDKDQALGALTDAIAAGFSQAKLMKEDPDLASLRGGVRFERLVQQAGQRGGDGH